MKNKTKKPYLKWSIWTRGVLDCAWETNASQGEREREREVQSGGSCNCIMEFVRAVASGGELWNLYTTSACKCVVSGELGAVGTLHVICLEKRKNKMAIKDFMFSLIWIVIIRFT